MTNSQHSKTKDIPTLYRNALLSNCNVIKYFTSGKLMAYSAVISAPKYLTEIAESVPSTLSSAIALLIASLKESLSAPFARGTAYIVTSGSTAATLSSVLLYRILPYPP